MKIYITKDGFNLYDIFAAGVALGRSEYSPKYKGGYAPQEDWYAALDAAIGEKRLATLETQDQLNARLEEAGHDCDNPACAGYSCE
jgi:hypothetical protein